MSTTGRQSTSDGRVPQFNLGDVLVVSNTQQQEVQTATALVLPLLAYKASAIVQRVQLQWYLDASIALAAAALIVYASS